ncbi:hypothetical protein PA07A_2201 [Cutibacterium acnes P07A]|nr:hypothetical protein [Cutibacterium acnes P07A]
MSMGTMVFPSGFCAPSGGVVFVAGRFDDEVLEVVCRQCSSDIEDATY